MSSRSASIFAARVVYVDGRGVYGISDKVYVRDGAGELLCIVLFAFGNF